MIKRATATQAQVRRESASMSKADPVTIERLERAIGTVADIAGRAAA
jgi:hypothetical protein